MTAVHEEKHDAVMQRFVEEATSVHNLRLRN